MINHVIPYFLLIMTIAMADFIIFEQYINLSEDFATLGKISQICLK